MTHSWLLHKEDLQSEPKFFSFVQEQARKHLMASFGYGFNISSHCIEAMQHDLTEERISRVYGVNDFIGFIKFGYQKEACEVVEAELTHREDDKFLITKAVIRINSIKINENNPVFVIRYSYDKYGSVVATTVATFWTNNQNDNHSTLDLSKYFRQVHKMAIALGFAKQ